MSTVQDVDKIDLITYSKSENIVTLVMIEYRKWGEDHGQMYVELSEKFNNYLAFIESGQLHEEYPKEESYSIKIELLSEYEPTGFGKKVISTMNEYLENYGYIFEFRMV